MSPIETTSLIIDLKNRIIKTYNQPDSDNKNTEINEIAKLIHDNQQNIKNYFKYNIAALTEYITDLGEIDRTSPIYTELTELRSSISNSKGGKIKKSRRFKKKSRRFKKKSKRRS
jgi:cell fate (sporulation/competence/biofilm development) regulator YlbF (YheA/YmcA/DUF963 family)